MSKTIQQDMTVADKQTQPDTNQSSDTNSPTDCKCQLVASTEKKDAPQANGADIKSIVSAATEEALKKYQEAIETSNKAQYHERTILLIKATMCVPFVALVFAIWTITLVQKNEPTGDGRTIVLSIIIAGVSMWLYASIQLLYRLIERH